MAKKDKKTKKQKTKTNRKKNALKKATSILFMEKNKYLIESRHKSCWRVDSNKIIQGFYIYFL